MIFLKIEDKWYQTKFEKDGDIRFFTCDYIDVIYDDVSKKFSRKVYNDHSEMNIDALQLEFWMQDKETMMQFNEAKLIETKAHCELTKQVIKIDYV